MAAGYSFRPRAWRLALAALGCAAGIALGNWQTHRADEKKALAAGNEAARRAAPVEIPGAELSSSAVANKRVAARGEFDARHAVFLDNKQRRGRVGYEVVMPLRLQDSPLHVLVNRGWIESAARDAVPQVRTPAGPVRIEGRALERLPQPLAAGPSAGRVRQSVELEAFAAESGLRLQPFFIEQHSALDDGLLRDWPRPGAGVEKHESYALQWYSLAALAAVLGAVFSFRREGRA